MLGKILMVASIGLLFVTSFLFVFAESAAQKCVTTTIMSQIGIHDAGMDATFPDEMADVVDDCVRGHTARGALYLGVSSIAAAVLGAILSARLIARPSTNVSAHYELDTHKLVLRFNRPVIAQNPQRMILLYSHTDGMATVVLGQQCGDGGLTLSFITNMKESPTHMELIICSGAMHPAGSPELDVCADGRPAHLDVDILHCDT